MRVLARTSPILRTNVPPMSFCAPKTCSTRARNWERFLLPAFSRACNGQLRCGNLNTHDAGSLYTTFESSEAKRIMGRLQLVFTPKHGSWLNVAELELSVLTRQSLSDRLGSEAAVAGRVGPWSQERNRKQIGVDWHFTTQDARTKPKRLYPKIKR